MEIAKAEMKISFHILSVQFSLLVSGLENQFWLETWYGEWLALQIQAGNVLISDYHLKQY